MSIPAQGAVGAETKTAGPGDLLYRSEWETARTITHEEAHEIARRLIASHFRRGDCETARASIPANPDRDDDLLINAYIKQQARKDAALASPRADSDERTAGEVSVEAGLIEMMAADHARMRAAGTALAEAALRVVREYDGTHRLSLAVAEWSKAIANEGGRADRHATPAQPAGAVPDSLRARFQQAIDDFESEAADAHDMGERPDLWDEVVEVPISDVRDVLKALASHPAGQDEGCDWCLSLTGKRDPHRSCAKCAPLKRLASHPAGQSATAEPDPTLIYWIESETERLCNLYPEAAYGIVEFREELVGLMEGEPAGQSAESGADLFEASRRLIVEWGDAPELPEEMENALTRFGKVWLALDDGKPAPDSTRTGQAEETVTVPASALRWLFGDGPDADGVWFGDQLRGKGAFWWRSEFRKRIEAARPATPEVQGAWSFELTPEQKPVKGFPNRAGETDTDDAIAAELEAAGIEINRWEGLRELSGEVKTAVRGALHGWHFERAWYYWMAKGPGIELAAANILHAAHPETVRVNGHCGCPSPREQNHGLAIGSYHVDSPAGLKGLADTIKAIVARSAPPASSGQEG